MWKRKLGRSGVEVSPLGLGCWAIGGPFQRTSDGVAFSSMGWGEVNDAESIRAIQQAINKGINFFDTANNYGAGHSERILGQAVAGHRHQIILATKFGSVFDETTKIHFDQDEAHIITPEFIREACEASLRRLQTDYIDLYQLHVGDYSPDRAITVRDTLEELVAEGKIRWYGWSTDDPDSARLFAMGEHCTAIQHRLNVLFDAPEMLAVCEEFNLASINRSPLSSGFLTGKFTAETTFSGDDGRHGITLKEGSGAERLKQIEALRPILTRNGHTMAQGGLAWILTRYERTIPISGFKTVQQVDDNVGTLNMGVLSAAQMQEIEALLARHVEK